MALYRKDMSFDINRETGLVKVGNTDVGYLETYSVDRPTHMLTFGGTCQRYYGDSAVVNLTLKVRSEHLQLLMDSFGGAPEETVGEHRKMRT